MVGDGFLGDIAIDEVKLLTESCSTSPNQAKAKSSVGKYLNKKFRYKRHGTSHISHLSGAKYKFVLLQSWHVVESSVLQTKHA